MAQHDFVPAWLNFSTPQPAKVGVRIGVCLYFMHSQQKRERETEIPSVSLTDAQTPLTVFVHLSMRVHVCALSNEMCLGTESVVRTWFSRGSSKPFQLQVTTKGTTLGFKEDLLS